MNEFNDWPNYARITKEFQKGIIFYLTKTFYSKYWGKLNNFLRESLKGDYNEYANNTICQAGIELPPIDKRSDECADFWEDGYRYMN